MAEWLAAMREAGIGHVLCLNGAAEIAQKSPGYAALLESGAIAIRPADPQWPSD